MSTIDIRNAIAPDCIVVADKSSSHFVANQLTKAYIGFDLEDSDEQRTLRVADREQAENLIKGLQKAIELGWV